MSKKRLMVDMDDVICTKGFLRLINKFLCTDYTYDDFKGFYMQDIIPNKDEFFKWFINQNIYEHCELIPDCYEVLKELNEKYELYIATDYVYPEIANRCGYIVEQKFNYLQKELPFINARQYIFLANKNVLNMDIKIDDKITNLEGAGIKLLFSAFHNTDISDSELQSMGIERMNSWNDIRDRLLN